MDANDEKLLLEGHFPEPLTPDVAALTLPDRLETLIGDELTIAEIYANATNQNELWKPTGRFGKHDSAQLTLKAKDAVPSCHQPDSPYNKPPTSHRQKQLHEQWHETQDVIDPRCPFCKQPEQPQLKKHQSDSALPVKPVGTRSKTPSEIVKFVHGAIPVFLGEYEPVPERVFARFSAHSMLGTTMKPAYRGVIYDTNFSSISEDRRKEIEAQVKAFLIRAGVIGATNKTS